MPCIAVIGLLMPIIKSTRSNNTWICAHEKRIVCSFLIHVPLPVPLTYSRFVCRRGSTPLINSSQLILLTHPHHTSLLDLLLITFSLFFCPSYSPPTLDSSFNPPSLLFFPVVSIVVVLSLLPLLLLASISLWNGNRGLVLCLSATLPPQPPTTPQKGPRKVQQQQHTLFLLLLPTSKLSALHLLACLSGKFQSISHCSFPPPPQND